VPEYEVVYNVRLTKEQLAALIKRVGNALEVADRFGGGNYNIGLLWAERKDEFLRWCEGNGVVAKMV
jgi:hypothetical protein